MLIQGRFRDNGEAGQEVIDQADGTLIDLIVSHVNLVTALLFLLSGLLSDLGVLFNILKEHILKLTLDFLLPLRYIGTGHEATSTLDVELSFLLLI